MQVTILTLPLDPATGGFRTEPLDELWYGWGMDLFEEFFAIIQALDGARIRCAVVGGLAMAFHDEPRFT